MCVSEEPNLVGEGHGWHREREAASALSCLHHRQPGAARRGMATAWPPLREATVPGGEHPPYLSRRGPASCFPSGLVLNPRGGWPERLPGGWTGSFR